jgi:hypothetical protein
MGFFSKIARALGGNAAEGDDPRLIKELESLNKDGRLHARYVVHGDGIATLKLDNGLSGIVKDISYGGMAVRFGQETQALQEGLPSSLRGTLHLLDQSVKCRLSPVRVVSQNSKVLFVGFSLHHEGPETLVFLRDFIEPLRCGRSMAALPTDLRQDRYRGPEWSCYRGEGPTDLLVKSLRDDEIEEGLLTFRINEAYCEITYKNGVLKTGRNIDREGVAVRMGSNIEANPQILRSAIYILMSSPAACRKVARPIMREAMKALKLDWVESSAA